MIVFLFAVSSVKAYAAPRFTITPTSGTYSVGTSFSVIVGVNSDTEKVVAMDVVGVFDKSKLQLISVEKITTPDPAFQFSFDSNTALIHNDTGKFEATLSPLGTSVFDGVVTAQNLLTLYFMPIASGTANVSFSCTQGAVNDSNILNPSSVDVTTCTANDSGSYTIQAAVGGSTTTTSTPTPTTTVTTTTSTTAELPKTGGLTTTMGLIVFGAISMASALFLKLL